EEGGAGEQHSTSELFSSANVVAETAQANISGEAEKVDKAKAANAAGDLLDAAGQYGKHDDQIITILASDWQGMQREMENNDL
ncbi:nodulin-related protein 1-like, partial [Arachis ipaensis]|uniref:nodulin-related protein 1-like n=1 Tax=Arachis ipaensis TaxID=130454 RepID=UPI0007AF2CA2